MDEKNRYASISEAESAIGYTYNNKCLLTDALTHSSFANEAASRGENRSSNERLEFLGDSVLSLVVSKYIFEKYPELPEGELSKIRSQTVCEKALASYAREIGLGSCLYLGHGEIQNKGAERDSILSDAFEAVIASIFLDSGDDSVKGFLMPFVIKQTDKIMQSHMTTDYKTLLQQIVQQDNGDILDYCITNETGPAHMRVFEVEARLNSNVIGHGKAGSKREAEQIAAQEALKLFGALQE